MSDDNSKLVPLLPISNRTVKRLRADDSVHTYVKVGHRQTPYNAKSPLRKRWGLFAFVQLCTMNLRFVLRLSKRPAAPSIKLM